MKDAASTGGPAALDVSLAYYRAWTAKDFDTAMTFVASDIVCETPGGTLHGAVAFRGFMEPFSMMVTRSELTAAFGDDRTSLMMYDAHTLPVSPAPGAECHTVQDGRITHLRIIFDRQPFTEARAAGPR